MLMQIQRTNYGVLVNENRNAIIKKNISFGTIYRAFVVQGGTDVTRKGKISELSRSDAYGIVCDYVSECGKKIGLIFATNHKDFDNMNFDKVSKLAGTAKLAENFGIRHFKGNKDPNFGIIDISDTYIPMPF